MLEVVRVYEGGKGRHSSNLVAVPDSQRLTDKKILTFLGQRMSDFRRINDQRRRINDQRSRALLEAAETQRRGTKKAAGFLILVFSGKQNADIRFGSFVWMS